jgi:5-methylcytosine-specific restriction endonuclease McrA
MERKEAKELGLKHYDNGKPCPKCGKSERYTSSYSCVSCTLDRTKENLYNEELMSKYRTKEKTAARLRRWRENNYEKFQQQWLRYPEKNCARQAVRRGRKLDQTPEDADLDLIQEIYTRCAEISKETGIPHEVDHIVPIARGGLHHQDNLQIITRTHNRRKGAKLDYDMKGDSVDEQQ